MTAEIGLIGLEAIGGGVAANLLEKGFALRCYARKPSAAAAFERSTGSR